MKLYGRLIRGENSKLFFAGDLITNLDNADAVAERINRSIDKYIEENKINAPRDTIKVNNWVPPIIGEIDLYENNISTIIWATGYGIDFSWIDAPVFDETGYPIYHRGVTDLPGLYFLGLNWLWTWGSGRIYSAGDDAKYIHDHLLSSKLMDKKINNL
jgi:putative flavoprotein involved in K+ transport